MNPFKWITGLFGSSDSADNVLEKAADGIYNGLDKLFYTDEEKAEGLAKGRALFLDFAKVAYDQNSIRSVTRRWLAFMVMGPIMLIVILSAIFYGIGIFFLDTVDDYNTGVEYAKFLFDMVIMLAPWGTGVMIFYYGPHLIGSFNSKGK